MHKSIMKLNDQVVVIVEFDDSEICDKWIKLLMTKLELSCLTDRVEVERIGLITVYVKMNDDYSLILSAMAAFM